MARDQVFISYSRKDKDWLERLQTMLVPLTRAGFKIWADTDIKPGEEWKRIIEQALARTKVAVLLVSPDFLASPFIHENELPPLLEAAKTQGLTILWVPVRPSLYKRTVIFDYQAAHPPSLPLSTLEHARQEDALVRIAEMIEEALLAEVIAPPSKPLPAIQSAHKSLPAIQSVHGWLGPRVQALQQQTAQALGLPVEFSDELESGGQGPAMVVIPGGRFLMGSPADELKRESNERQHEVEVTPFAMGKYAVTFEEYDRFAGATGRKRPSDEGWGRGRRPVINVSWFDAVAYTQWLSEQMSQGYRLPTEAEWEYACRAGTTTPFHFGVTISTEQANYNGNYKYGEGRKGVYRRKTMEVGQFPANAWGLQEMHGNVWEWTGSEYDEGYDGAEQRCVSGPGSSGRRVLRGGSWLDGTGTLRGAARYGFYPSIGLHSAGFRLARTFPSTL